MGLRRHLLILVTLVGLSTSIQVWMVSRAIVPAQDAVRFVAVAQSIERDGLRATWRRETGPPVFPFLVASTHELLRPWLGGARGGWARSAQIAAAVPLVMTVVPLYLLLLRLFDARSAAAAALLFCVMTEVARLGADGIADSTHLLFFMVALLSGAAFFDRVTASGCESKQGESRLASGIFDRFRVHLLGVGTLNRRTENAGRRRGASWADPLAAAYIAVAGVASAVALLAKSEAIILIGVLAASIALFQLPAAWHLALPRAAAWSGCFALGMAVVVVPYFLLAGADDAKVAVTMLRGRNDPATWAIVNPPPASDDTQVAEARRASTVSALRSWRLSDGRRLSFAARERSVSSRFHGYRAAAAEFVSELGLALHYFLLPLVVYGLWRSRPTRPRAAHALIAVFCVVYAVVALHYAATAGYLSTRHVLPLVVFAIGWAGRGALDLGRRLAEATANRLKRVGPAREGLRPAVGWTIVLFLALGCLVRTVAPLHSARAAHRQASEWLATQTAPSDRVLDIRGWTGLYSGRTTYRYHAAKLAFSDLRLAYVVIERRELDFDSRRSGTLRRLLDESAIEAAVFARPDARAAKDVIVYRWDARRFAERLGASILAN